MLSAEIPGPGLETLYIDEKLKRQPSVQITETSHPLTFFHGLLKTKAESRGPLLTLPKLLQSGRIATTLPSELTSRWQG